MKRQKSINTRLKQTVYRVNFIDLQCLTEYGWNNRNDSLSRYYRSIVVGSDEVGSLLVEKIFRESYLNKIGEFRNYEHFYKGSVNTFDEVYPYLLNRLFIFLVGSVTDCHFHEMRQSVSSTHPALLLTIALIPHGVNHSIFKMVPTRHEIIMDITEPDNFLKISFNLVESIYYGFCVASLHDVDFTEFRHIMGEKKIDMLSIDSNFKEYEKSFNELMKNNLKFFRDARNIMMIFIIKKCDSLISVSDIHKMKLAICSSCEHLSEKFLNFHFINIKEFYFYLQSLSIFRD